jgi:hypothetical protein
MPSVPLALALAAAAALCPVQARQQYVATLPNGGNVPTIAALGHVSAGGGGSRNAFGSAYPGSWTRAYCQQDSDGDGLTNGVELGDPCCTWTQGQAPAITSDLSHPGRATGDYARPASRTCSALACTNGVDPCTPIGAASAAQVGALAAAAALAATLFAAAQ